MMAESRGIFVPSNQLTNTESVTKNANRSSSVSPNETSPESDGTTSKTFTKNPDFTQVTTKIEFLKKWIVNTYKTTKQSINEQFGKVKRTVDKDLEVRIEALRELQRIYLEVLALARGFTNNFLQANNVQKNLSEAVYQLSCKEEILNNVFAIHSEALAVMSQNGEIFIRALNCFISSVETLADKTIQDTLLTVDQHDQARLEYDVFRCQLEHLQSNPTTVVSVTETEEKCNEQKIKYESLKEDIRVKLTLLEKNRCKVMRRQIALIQNAFSIYFSGSLSALEGAVNQLKEASTSSSLQDNDPMQPSTNKKKSSLNLKKNYVPNFL